MNLKCVVLDMDGVILDSEEIKISCFSDLFRDFPRQLEAIDQFNREYRGIPRRKKFVHILKNILHEEPSETRLQNLHSRYSETVLKKMKGVSLITGVDELLKTPGISFFANSAAPVEEVRLILGWKGILSEFDDVYGFPNSKLETLQALQQRWSSQEMVFFGDALADYEAARIAGVPFVGVCGGREDTPLHSLDVPIIRDFTEPSNLLTVLMR